MHTHLVDATLFHTERLMDSYTEAESCSLQRMYEQATELKQRNDLNKREKYDSK